MSETTYSKNYSDENAVAVKNPIADALDRLTAAFTVPSSDGGSSGQSYETTPVTVYNQSSDNASVAYINDGEIALKPSVVDVYSDSTSFVYAIIGTFMLTTTNKFEESGSSYCLIDESVTELHIISAGK